MSKKLKYVRIIVALYFFIILILSFLNIPGLTSGWALIESATFFQVVPSLLRYSLIPGTIIGFVLVFILTILYGRVYCSAICPLGIFQDIISRIGKRFRKRKIYRYSKAKNYLRYGLLILVILSLLTGSIFLLNLLDPYSNFGKIWSGLFRPLFIIVNDSLSYLLEKAGSYYLSPVGIRSFQWQVLVFPFIFLFTIIIMAAFRGRLFCNTICPVGSFLAIVSKISIYKLKINESTCTSCGKCSTACKAECIDIKLKQVDFTRCVGCFNCIQACPENSINYKKIRLYPLKSLKIEPEGNLNSSQNRIINNCIKIEIPDTGTSEPVTIPSSDRRKFIQKAFVLFASVCFLGIKAEETSGKKSGLVFFRKNTWLHLRVRIRLKTFLIIAQLATSVLVHVQLRYYNRL